MPYIKDSYGNERYKVSSYAKEELPTWNEIYKWYIDENKSYTLNNDPVEQKIDIYWKLPKRKVDICFICNHLNKLLYEDGYLDKICDEFESYKGMKLYFSITLDRVGHKYELISTGGSICTDVYHTTDRLYGGIPVLYTLEIPKTGCRSPFASNKPHNYINMIPMNNGDSIYISLRDASNTDIVSSEIENDILGFMLKDLIEYFGGDYIGWKDNDKSLDLSDLRTLQAKTGKPMSLCREALESTDGNINDAVTLLINNDMYKEVGEYSNGITKDDVYRLHKITGCLLMECKKALIESDNDQEKAIAILKNRPVIHVTGMNGLLGHKPTI